MLCSTDARRRRRQGRQGLSRWSGCCHHQRTWHVWSSCAPRCGPSACIAPRSCACVVFAHAAGSILARAGSLLAQAAMHSPIHHCVCKSCCMLIAALLSLIAPLFARQSQPACRSGPGFKQAHQRAHSAGKQCRGASRSCSLWHGTAGSQPQPRGQVEAVPGQSRRVR